MLPPDDRSTPCNSKQLAQLLQLEAGPEFQLLGPGIYFFLGGTMTGKSAAIKKILVERDRLIDFQIQGKDSTWREAPLRKPFITQALFGTRTRLANSNIQACILNSIALRERKSS